MGRQLGRRGPVGAARPGSWGFTQRGVCDCATLPLQGRGRGLAVWCSSAPSGRCGLGPHVGLLGHMKGTEGQCCKHQVVHVCVKPSVPTLSPAQGPWSCCPCSKPLAGGEVVSKGAGRSLNLVAGQWVCEVSTNTPSRKGITRVANLFKSKRIGETICVRRV